MGISANKALIRAHYEATVNNFDAAAIDEQVADDFFDHAAGERLGPEGVKKHIRGLKDVFPDLRVSIEDIVAEDDRVAVRARCTARIRVTFAGYQLPISRSNSQEWCSGGSPTTRSWSAGPLWMCSVLSEEQRSAQQANRPFMRTDPWPLHAKFAYADYTLGLREVELSIGEPSPRVQHWWWMVCSPSK